LPKFRREWVRAFMEGYDLRKEMWRRLNANSKGASEAGADKSLAVVTAVTVANGIAIAKSAPREAHV
jgi:hypothetical protein